MTTLPIHPPVRRPVHRTSRARLALSAAVLAVVAGCATAGSGGPERRSAYGPGDTLDVLFIGNSYVYYNNLADQLEGMSAALPSGPHLRTAHHLHGGFSLRQHLEDGHLPGVLAASAADGDPYEWVVIQEHSRLSVPYANESEGTLGSPAEFHRSARAVVGRVREHDGHPMFYMTWAKKAYPLQIGALASAYEEAGVELDVPVAPVGMAWARVRSERPEIELFHEDGSHPSPAGTYLTAAVFYATLSGRSPVGAPRMLVGTPMTTPGVVMGDGAPTTLVSLPEEVARYLQSVAWQTVSGYRGPM